MAGGSRLISTPVMPPEEQAVIRLSGVGKQYGDVAALKDISLSIYENDFVYVTGASGAGKSTLITLLYMGEPVTEGAILVDGVNLCRIPRRRLPWLRRKFGVIFQDFKLIPGRTVYENAALVLEASGVQPGEIKERVRSVLEKVGIAARANCYPPVLSGGEKQRAAVARAIVGEPRFILADEPTGSLDEASAARIFELLKSAHSEGATVIFATHNSGLVKSHDGPVVCLENGRLKKG